MFISTKPSLLPLCSEDVIVLGLLCLNRLLCVVDLLTCLLAGLFVVGVGFDLFDVLRVGCCIR